MGAAMGNKDGPLHSELMPGTALIPQQLLNNECHHHHDYYSEDRCPCDLPTPPLWPVLCQSVSVSPLSVSTEDFTGGAFLDIYYGQGMVLNNFTCPTLFKSHQPWRVGIVILIFQQRNLGLAGISPPDHRASSIQIHISLTEGLSSQPRVSFQG